MRAGTTTVTLFLLVFLFKLEHSPGSCVKYFPLFPRVVIVAACSKERTAHHPSCTRKWGSREVRGTGPRQRAGRLTVQASRVGIWDEGWTLPFISQVSCAKATLISLASIPSFQMRTTWHLCPRAAGGEKRLYPVAPSMVCGIVGPGKHIFGLPF